MRLIVGLGNPGKQYDKTRHNIGFRVLDSIRTDWVLSKRCDALISRAVAYNGSTEIIYAKPQTFMNVSGVSVKKLCQFFKVPLENITIVYDDKDLPFGTLRFRTTGSSGGHNGMKSIIAELSTEAIPRLRFGIAPVDSAATINDTTDFVLAKFSKTEEKILPEIIKQAQAYLTPTV